MGDGEGYVAVDDKAAVGFDDDDDDDDDDDNDELEEEELEEENESIMFEGDPGIAILNP